MENIPATNAAQPIDAQRQPKLLERMRTHLRTRHYSIRIEEAYIDWARHTQPIRCFVNPMNRIKKMSCSGRFCGINPQKHH